MCVHGSWERAWLVNSFCVEDNYLYHQHIYCTTHALFCTRFISMHYESPFVMFTLAKHGRQHMRVGTLSCCNCNPHTTPLHKRNNTTSATNCTIPSLARTPPFTLAQIAATISMINANTVWASRFGRRGAIYLQWHPPTDMLIGSDSYEFARV